MLRLTQEDDERVRQATGSGGALIGDSVLVSTTPVQPGRTYPEGGPNLTVYASPVVAGRAFGELENVGARPLPRRHRGTDPRPGARDPHPGDLIGAVMHALFVTMDGGGNLPPALLLAREITRRATLAVDLLEA